MAIPEQQYEPSEWSITTDDPILTPEPSEVGGPCHESDWRKAWDETNPWPGNAYMIIEKDTGRALTLRNGELLLAELGSGSQKVAQTMHNTWLCCEHNNYWGFQNKATGRYLGHDGGSSMRVDAVRIQAWEMFVARPVPGGGYQLLMPHYWHTLQVIALYNGGKHLTRRMHGGIVWEVRRV
ncbi:dynamin family [Apiospora marii]|uniref:Dynamin family n=1 Tax=Apiospora marii TaxID=335849 RepID=A0ABR1RJW3_9PEZI